MKSGVPVRELTVEAWRNLGPRQLMWAAAATVIGALVAIWIGTAATGALDAERQLRQAGSLVWVVQSAKGVALDGASCEALNASAGVAAAGGVAAALPPALSAYPAGKAVSVFYVTPRAVEVFLPGAPPGTTLVGGDLAATGLVGVGSWLFYESGAAAGQITGQLPQGVPVQEIGSSVTIPVAGQVPLRGCWVRFMPGAGSAAIDLLRFRFSSADVQIGPLQASEFPGPSPADRWAAASSVQPWLIAAGLLGGIAALLTWTRRSELAIYRAFGARRSHVMLLIGLELALVSAPGLPLAWLLATTTMNLAGVAAGATVQALMARSLIGAWLTGWSLGVALSGVVLSGTIPDQLKDR